MPDVVKILRGLHEAATAPEPDIRGWDAWLVWLDRQRDVDATLRTLLPELIGVVEAASAKYDDAEVYATDCERAVQALATAAAAVEKEGARDGDK